jgi:signal transduction histidine kinase
LEAYIRKNPDFLAHAVQIVRVVDVNDTTLRLFEAKSREELLGPIGNTFDQSSLATFAPRAIATAEKGRQHELETTVLTRTGRRLNVIMHFHVPADHDPFGNTLVSVIDITKRVEAEEERALLEDQLRHSQKMESVGHLAGGISHDINNLLTPILGYSQILLEDSIPNKQEVVESVLGAAGRIRDLTRKLLTFSRKQRLAKTVADLRTVVKDFEILLRQTVRKNVDLRIDLPEGLGMTKVDVGQIEQVIMNLSINAQDAMPHGGTLAITLRDVIRDEAWARGHRGISAGEYVEITVSDTGTGMDEETRKRVFEPFFTTKEPGKGTGLGLSTVYGIVRQHGGHIEVDSQKGWGTVFSIYFPRYVSPTSVGVSA